MSPVGEPGGDRLLGLLREKGIISNWGVFFDPEDIKSCLGAIWNFCKEKGFTQLVTLWGTKGPSIRPTCIGTVRPRTQTLIIIINPFFTFCSNNAMGTNLAIVRYKAFVPSLDNAYGIAMRVWHFTTFHQLTDHERWCNHHAS